MSDIARAQWSAAGQGNDAIVTQQWRIKPPYSKNALAVQLTGTNWASVAALLEGRGVHVSTTTAPVRLHFGGERGSYAMAPGDWIAIYGDSDQRGAEGWMDSDWRRIWELSPENSGKEAVNALLALSDENLAGALEGLDAGDFIRLHQALTGERR